MTRLFQLPSLKFFNGDFTKNGLTYAFCVLAESMILLLVLMRECYFGEIGEDEFEVPGQAGVEEYL